jgi:hypothetical protein
MSILGRGMPGWIAELSLSLATRVPRWPLASVEGVTGRAYHKRNSVPSVVGVGG